MLDRIETRKRAVDRFRAGDLAEAERLFRRLCEDDPASAETWVNLGALALHRQELAESEHCYRQGMLLDPAYVHARIGLAQVLLLAGRLDEALQTLQELNRDQLLTDQTRGTFNKLIGLIHDGKGDYDVAETFFGHYKEAAPDDLDPVLCLIRLSLNRGDPEAATVHLEELVRRFEAPAVAATALWLAREIAGLRGLRGVKAVLDALVERHGGRADVVESVVQLCLHKRNYAYAALYTRRALNRAPVVDWTSMPGVARMRELL